MANRFLEIILVLVINLPSAVMAEQSDDGMSIKPIETIEPKVSVRQIHESKIDTELFGLGFFIGPLTVENFGTDMVIGLRGTYYATRSIFIETNYGRSKVGKATFEELAGNNLTFFSDKDRDFEYYDLLLGYNIFPGKTFIGKNIKLNSAFYLIAGFGNTEFLSTSHFSVVIGGGYRMILTDSLAIHIDYRDRTFKRQLLDENKRTHNLELNVGISYFFGLSE